MKRDSILIVDDDKEFLSETSDALSVNGYRVLTACTGHEGYELAKKNRPTVAVLDKKLPDMDGLELVKTIKKESSETACIMITAFGTLNSSIESLRDGVSDYILKPVDPSSLLMKIRNIIRKRSAETEKLKAMDHEIKRSSEGLVRSEAKYRDLLSVVPGIVYLSKFPMARPIYISEGIEKLLGFSQAEWLATDGMWQKQLLPEDRERLLREIAGRNAISGKQELVYRMVHKDGKTVKWLKDSAMITKHEGGEYLVTGVMVDITDIKKAHEENEFLSRVARDINESIMVTDARGKIVHCNEAAERLFKYGCAELIDTDIGIIFSKYNPPSLRKDIDKKTVLGSGWRGEIVCVRKDDTSFPAMLWVDPLKDSVGRRRGDIIIATDITEKRLLESELRRHSLQMEETVKDRTHELEDALKKIEKANEKLIRLDTLKSEFVAAVAHEIGNPLATICESTRLMQEGAFGEMSEKAKRALDVSSKEIDRLLKFSKNMLDLTKIESGKMPVHKTKVDVAGLVKYVAEYFEALAKKKNISLSVEMGNVPENIMADEDLLKQVMINLVENALKYTSKGKGKSVKIRVLTDGASLRIEIVDQGPGIPEDKREKIFEKYYRIFSERETGTGLGLPIVKDIVTLHGGRVWVESKVGEGSVFIVVLPLS